jgi:hypothetical protein
MLLRVSGQPAPGMRRVQINLAVAACHGSARTQLSGLPLQRSERTCHSGRHAQVAVTEAQIVGVLPEQETGALTEGAAVGSATFRAILFDHPIDILRAIAEAAFREIR